MAETLPLGISHALPPDAGYATAMKASLGMPSPEDEKPKPTREKRQHRR